MATETEITGLSKRGARVALLMVNTVISAAGIWHVCLLGKGLIP
jgi:hypothetical protein